MSPRECRRRTSARPCPHDAPNRRTRATMCDSVSSCHSQLRQCELSTGQQTNPFVDGSVIPELCRYALGGTGILEKRPARSSACGTEWQCTRPSSQQCELLTGQPTNPLTMAQRYHGARRLCGDGHASLRPPHGLPRARWLCWRHARRSQVRRASCDYGHCTHLSRVHSSHRLPPRLLSVSLLAGGRRCADDGSGAGDTVAALGSLDAARDVGSDRRERPDSV